jgi:hypothetical protein
LSIFITRFFQILSFVAVTSVTLSYPIDTRSQVTSLDSGDFTAEFVDLSSPSATASNTTVDLSDVKPDATSKSSGSTTAKASTGQSTTTKASSG